MGKILVVEDERSLAADMVQFLELAGHQAVAADCGAEALKAVAVADPEVILLDHQLPDTTGLDLIDQLKKQGSHAAVIMVTAHSEIALAVGALRNGAADFLCKPVELEELRIAVDKALERRGVEQHLAYFRQRDIDRAAGLIIGDSPEMAAVRRLIERITASPALGSAAPPTVLITGETGTGKDLVAQTIHYNGPRNAAQFVRVNCTALPDQLVESELFGHMRGAFTDAHADKRGLFDIADGGTVFLDEIGHMKLPLQAKLLSVLERRCVRPVGSTREKTIDIHVIAATNRDLEAAVAAGEFRSDLYHRVRTLALHMPPVRDRQGDIMPLARHFLAQHAARFGIAAERFSPAAVERLEGYAWPGNVRELSHTIESAVLLADGGEVDARDIRCGGDAHEPQGDGGEAIVVDFDRDCPGLEEVQHRVIQYALDISGGNNTRAAQLLGISRDAIRYRLEKHKQRRG